MFKINRSESVSFYTHIIGAFAAVIGMIVLIARAGGDAGLIIVSLIYGLAMCGMFSFSTLYHATKRAENTAGVWRKLDHIAIFFMIAGSYTPLCYIYLSGAWRWSILSVSWAFVIAGLLLKIFFIRAPRWASTVLYLMMGWLAVVPLRELWIAMPRSSFFLLLGGGLVYSLGALIYIIKRPDPRPGVFGFHEIFHVLILTAAVMHYIPMYVGVGG
ncbi:MAG: hemolysin III family protein [Dehalococcoidia bacterium]|nr:hemolysin III family protein [Dehalococcoidia bacterium]